MGDGAADSSSTTPQLGANCGDDRIRRIDVGMSFGVLNADPQVLEIDGQEVKCSRRPMYAASPTVAGFKRLAQRQSFFVNLLHVTQASAAIALSLRRPYRAPRVSVIHRLRGLVVFVILSQRQALELRARLHLRRVDQIGVILLSRTDSFGTSTVLPSFSPNARSILWTLSPFHRSASGGS